VEEISTNSLSIDRRLRCSKLQIPWGDSSIEVRHGDLYPEPQRELFKEFPNMKLSLSSIRLPRSVYWKRILGQFKNLYIISPESSPNSSPENSQWGPNSRQPTFKSDGTAPTGEGKPTDEDAVKPATNSPQLS
jgi:hypothetical protein